MPGSDSITIVVPALNEEEKLAWSVNTTVGVVRRFFGEYEILIIDDGSTDRTREVATALAAEDPAIRVYGHDRPRGLGGALKHGLELARMRYFFWVDGKGATSAEAIAAVFARREQADIIVLYATNQNERPWIRKVIASAFRESLNLLFGMRLRQHTHPALCEVALVRRAHVRTDSHAFQAEALVKLLKGGCSYIEVGVRDDFSRQRLHSKAFRLVNVFRVAAFFLTLLFDVYVLRRHRLIRPPAPLLASRERRS